MSKRLTFAIVTLTVIVAQGVAFSQVTYNDVLVVINTNSAQSDSIGTYFQQARNIPDVNIARIAVSSGEEIDSTEFNYLRSQLETYILGHNLQNQINYIVTTKGMPLKVNRGNTFSSSSPSSSVESELTLILGAYSGYIGGNGLFFSPYYYQAAHFSRTAYGIYLVTRLDGYTVADVLHMIDISGPNVYMPPTTQFVFDQDPSWNSSLPGLNNNLATARTRLVNKGLSVDLNQDSVYVTQRTNVAGYASWGSNDRHADQYTQFAIPQHTWAPGAIAETYVSTSGRTFTNPASYGQSLIADLIAEGISGAKGYVYEPYSTAMAITWLLFDRYTSDFNLAESFYLASRALSWMDVVVGDPKTSITFTAPLPIQLGSFNAQLVGSTVRLNWTTVSEVNNYGFEIQRRAEGTSEFVTISGSFVPGYGTTLEPRSYTYSDSLAPAGTTSYRLKQIDLDGTIHYHESVQIENNVVAGAEDNGSLAREFRLAQNFPNPFNPSTEIKFSVPTGGRASLKVYNSIGQEIAALVDGEVEAGAHSAQFNANNLASGTYFYQLRTGDNVATQKMMLIK